MQICGQRSDRGTTRGIEATADRDHSLGFSAAAGGIPFSQTSLISLNASTRFCLNVSVDVSGFDTFDSIPNLTSLSPARSASNRIKSVASGCQGAREETRS